MFRSKDRQANLKINLLIESKQPEENKMEITRDAMRFFRELIHTTCHEEFDKAWKSYQEKYADQEEWISYLKTQWITQIEKWWIVNSQVT